MSSLTAENFRPAESIEKSEGLMAKNELIENRDRGVT
jgi:hypothetical protein